MNILIIEDEIRASQQLQAMLQKHFTAFYGFSKYHQSRKCFFKRL